MAKKIRNIIEIDEERCTGCGQCALDCAEGAIALVDGKAKVIADMYCDGLGVCLSGCPADALRIIRREADDFDKDAVRKHLLQGRAAPNTLNTVEACEGISGVAGEPGLRHWPLKIRLVHEEAPFLQGADLLVAADCAAFAASDFHQRLADGKVMLIGCPKFEGSEILAHKLAAIVQTAKPGSLLLARMEVPCCRGLSKACLDALQMAGEELPRREVVVSRAGEVTG
jgi:Pyruvate/2-oxoacid:ferredoxin oxidoreductase delta subunit